MKTLNSIYKLSIVVSITALAAALLFSCGTANAGWYVMEPPSAAGNVFWTAPMGYWTQVGDEIDSGNPIRDGYDCFKVKLTRTRNRYAQCVNSYDSRLKEKKLSDRWWLLDDKSSPFAP